MPTSRLARRTPRRALVIAISLLFAACAGPVNPTTGPGSGEPSSGGPSSNPATSSPAPSGGPSTTGSAPPVTISPTPPVAPSPSASLVASCATATLDGLNEGQRVGQLFLLGLANDRLGPAEQAAIETDHFGSVWFTTKTQAGVAAIRTVADAVQALASPSASGPGSAGIGFFVGANQEGGLVQALAGPGFATIPSALVQGGRPTAELKADALTWAGQLKAAGVNLNFAPVSDVVPAATANQNQPIGVLRREYGHTAAVAGAHASAFMTGMGQAGIVTVAKHFPGLGRVVGNTDFSANVVDTVTSASDPDLGSFKDVISAGVPIVMVALATYTRIDPDHLAAFSPIVINQLLRGQLGFTGVVMSDDLGATIAVANIPPGTRGIDFIAAGGDMIISKTIAPAEAMAVAITARASADPTFRTQVNAAALRVLELKASVHLLPCAGQ
ncbi:MAG: glycoside hydrolase family 3 N-terminal domain-containing protein [Candidatus Limnocylindrales bacterium]